MGVIQMNRRRFLKEGAFGVRVADSRPGDDEDGDDGGSRAKERPETRLFAGATEQEEGDSKAEAGAKGAEEHDACCSGPANCGVIAAAVHECDSDQGYADADERQAAGTLPNAEAQGDGYGR